ncbi:hypothetical protein NPA31_001340 [Aurantimonas sp. MSK8Z-1]|uniref:hypothetical protein n=1 Tax=Mangrovibrevibacter kandeliae TaxID=2968473 RepID=UPI002117F70F|nr:hypothetical protein [Aurantimonas sp. MSK8Z-1]MCW4113604.1 hypothetical protein [Aurantimonas sp. MSK8Z-1]
MRWLWIIGALVLFAPVRVQAAAWTADTEGARASAGLDADGASLRLVCQRGDGRLDLRAAAADWHFAPAAPATIAASVDLTAYILEGRAAADDPHALLHRASFEAMAGLLSALKGGHEVEIATPQGRLTLPLTGSSKAIAALEAACRG